MSISNFNKYPVIEINTHQCINGWEKISAEIESAVQVIRKPKIIVAVDTYHGVYTDEILKNLKLPVCAVFEAETAMLREENIDALVYQYVTDDPVFGYMCPLNLKDFFAENKVSALQREISEIEAGLILVAGAGASLMVPEADILIYADMPRWEIQLRFRKNRISNLGIHNPEEVFSNQYKRALFVDWKVFDRHKKNLMQKWDFVLDTTIEDQPKMVSGSAMKEAFNTAMQRPFRVVPFFDPGPWGGQWLKEVCDLDRSAQNYAWGFDCVPEENSVVFEFEGGNVEIPSVNLVYAHPEALLGEKVYEAFGDEFPIRFDFLDTMEGGNLSLQVHPLHEYIRENFGMGYTQNESYYMLDAMDDATVYLGLKTDIVPENMLRDLEISNESGEDFEAEKYVEKWPAKKHDHFLIPAGTVHCSGANSVVLEISATPFIFTFKLWDWGRMGLDGKPRPISLEHGKNNIQWDRTTDWTRENLVNRFVKIKEGEGWYEEQTGLESGSFIETRRHWFSEKVSHSTNGVVNVINLIEGAEAIVESPTEAFPAFVVHYAETFIVPASVGDFTIRPYGESEGKTCATIKAYIRTEQLLTLNLK